MEISKYLHPALEDKIWNDNLEYGLTHTLNSLELAAIFWSCKILDKT